MSSTNLDPQKKYMVLTNRRGYMFALRFSNRIRVIEYCKIGKDDSVVEFDGVGDD